MKNQKTLKTLKNINIENQIESFNEKIDNLIIECDELNSSDDELINSLTNFRKEFNNFFDTIQINKHDLVYFYLRKLIIILYF